MHATIDKAGRLVIPSALRDRVGLRPGPVEISVSGAGLVIEPLATDALVEVDGLLQLVAGEELMTVDDVRELRDADQR
jgi:AbrB family looped-hinge helix DNA binding protein